MESKSLSTLWDILTGVVVAVISFFLFQVLTLNIALMVFSPLPVIAGYIRGNIGSSDKKIEKIFMMNLLFFVLGMAIMNGVFHLILVLAIALLGTTLGIYIRQYVAKSAYKVVGALSIFIATVLLSGFWIMPTWIDAIMWDNVQNQAPQFDLVTLDGDTISSSEYDERVIVLNFWATWCGPCKKQFPFLEKLYKENLENDNVVFLVVNPMIGGDTPEKSLNYINQSEYDLPFINDLESAAYTNFDVSALPSTFIIDKNGFVRYKQTGFSESGSFYETMNKHLNQLQSR